MGYPRAATGLNPTTGKGFNGFHRANPILQTFRAAVLAVNPAFRISTRALFLMRLGVVVCGDTSEKCRDQPKLTDAFVVP
jgi:hypothetical protein